MFIVYRSSRNAITTENNYGSQRQPLDHETAQQLPVYATPFSRHQADYETPVSIKTPLDYQTPVSVRDKHSSLDTQHYYSTADVGNTGTGCEEYSEPVQPPNTAGIFNPTYMNKSVVMSNAEEEH